MATVRVTDNEAITSDATVTVTPASPLAISPTTVTLNMGNSIVFSASGGVPPYTYSLPAPISGTGGEGLAGNTYTAPSDAIGTATVRVTDNALATSDASVTVPDVDYIVTQVNYLGGTPNPGDTVNGNFEFQNVGADNGTQKVSWTAYASKDNILDATDAFVDSGTGLSPLTAGSLSALIPFSGTWPLDYSFYFLIVEVWASDDFVPANNTGASVGTTAVGFFDESANEPNGDWIALSDYYDLGITLQPGMSVLVSGSMTIADIDDILAFNTGTAGSVTVAMNWSANQNITIYIMDAASSFPAGIGITGSTSLSLTWQVDVASTMRWIDVENSFPKNIGAYTLIITAN